MKYIVILGDGMADEPLAELGGRTPLEYADIPNMDRIAREEVKVSDNEVSHYYHENIAEFERGPRVHARMMLFTDRGSAEALACCRPVAFNF